MIRMNTNFSFRKYDIRITVKKIKKIRWESIDEIDRVPVSRVLCIYTIHVLQTSIGMNVTKN